MMVRIVPTAALTHMEAEEAEEAARVDISPFVVVLSHPLVEILV